MKDSFFDIVSKKIITSSKQKQASTILYQNYHQNYISLSYGYYTEIFIKRMTQKSQIKYQKLLQFHLRKLLRQTITKYLMTDLQTIYLSYFTNEHEWNFNHPIIVQALNGTQIDPQMKQTDKIKLFLNLIAFFVKSYVGSKDELTVLIDFHKENMLKFLSIYKLWMDHNPKKLFLISPRELNQIYTEYSRNCGKKVHRKDYNEMVDQILDLSTTYTIVPSKIKKNNEKIEIKEKEEISIPNPVKCTTRNQSISDLQKSYKIQFSDLKSQKKESIILSRLSSLFIPNIQAQKMEVKQYQKGLQPRKLISLNKKKKVDKNQPNNVAKSFFCNKQITFSVQDTKKSDMNIKEGMNFLDLDSRIQNVPFVYQNSSNIFSPSNLF